MEILFEIIITLLFIKVIFEQHKTKSLIKRQGERIMGALKELQTKTTDILTGIGDLITLAKGDLAGAVTSE